MRRKITLPPKERYRRAQRVAATTEMRLRQAVQSWHRDHKLSGVGRLLGLLQHFCNAREVAVDARTEFQHAHGCERCPCCGRKRTGPEGACPECGFPYGD